MDVLSTSRRYLENFNPTYERVTLPYFSKIKRHLLGIPLFLFFIFGIPIKLKVVWDCYEGLKMANRYRSDRCDAATERTISSLPKRKKKSLRNVFLRLISKI